MIELPVYEMKVKSFDNGDGSLFSLDCAYTLHGHCIGSKEDADALVSKGINPEYISEESTICSVGFCDKENKWYGWSHRAIYGFTIGDKIKKGDCGYTSDSIDDLHNDYVSDWGTDPKLITKLPDGIRIEHEMVKYDDEPALDGSLVNPEPAESEFHEIRVGKGEWIASTLEEAREMAVAFAQSVS